MKRLTFDRLSDIVKEEGVLEVLRGLAQLSIEESVKKNSRESREELEKLNDQLLPILMGK